MIFKIDIGILKYIDNRSIEQSKLNCLDSTEMI